MKRPTGHLTSRPEPQVQVPGDNASRVVRLFALRGYLALLGLLAVVGGIAYGQAFDLPFLNDDYVFLEEVRNLSFFELWSPEHTYFGWYRPWSRELHYWLIRKVAGLDEGPYHAVSFALWLGVLLLYFALLYRVRGPVVAGIATAGLTALALWSAPLLWIAGAQDLWMLFFSLLALLFASHRRMALSSIALLLALLSKETAAAVPGIISAYCLLVDGDSIRQTARRVAVQWTLLTTWLLLHPILLPRLLGHFPQSIETETRPTLLVTALKTLLVQVNLEDRLAPESGWEAVLLKGGLIGLLLALLVLMAARSWPPPPPSQAGQLSDQRLIAFGSAWALLGWSVLFMPSISWHGYYGVLGSLGCWLVLGTMLHRHVPLAIALVLCVAVLREARVATPSWDWGTYWFQKRSGSFLEAVRHRLRGLYPTIPAHSRLFFTRMPNNIGFLAGDGPAVRVWYDDPTLEARYFSSYTARTPGDTSGRDLFFRYDSLTVLVEIHPGRTEPPSAIRAYLGWQRDHEVLASLFIRSGNTHDAAEEYEKLWLALPERPDYALLAATAYEAVGDSGRAAPLFTAARSVFGDSVVQSNAALLVESARRYRATALRAAIDR